MVIINSMTVRSMTLRSMTVHMVIIKSWTEALSNYRCRQLGTSTTCSTAAATPLCGGWFSLPCMVKLGSSLKVTSCLLWLFRAVVVAGLLWTARHHSHINSSSRPVAVVWLRLRRCSVAFPFRNNPLLCIVIVIACFCFCSLLFAVSFFLLY